MNKTIKSILDVGFFAVALVFFIPPVQSVPEPYGYFPEGAFVAVAMSISRAFAWRNNRQPVVCVLEVLLVTIAFVVDRMSLNM